MDENSLYCAGVLDCPVLTCIVRTQEKKEDVKKKPFRAAFHRHEEGDGAYVKLGSRHQGAPNPVVVHT